MTPPPSEGAPAPTPADDERRPAGGALRSFRSRAPPSLRPAVRYAIAPAAVIFTGLVQHLLLPDPRIAPFVFFYLGIALVAWIAGRGPGLVTVLLSAIGANWLWVAPSGQLVLVGPPLTATLLFLVSAGAVALLCAMFRDALVEAQRTSAQLRRQATVVQLAAQAERESQARFRTLADNIAQLAWMADEKGNVFWFNERWRQYTGVPVEEARGDHWRRLVHPDHAERVVASLQRSFAAGGPWEDTFPLRGSDGTYRWFLSRAVSVRDEQGRVVRWLGTNTDVTAQRDAEEALRVANEHLEEADRRKNEFLGVLSHELRNPLSPIHNALYIASRAVPGSEQARRALAVLDRQAHQLTRIVDDLLDVTRIARGKVRLQRERLDLQALARRTAEDYHDLFERSGHELEVILADEPLLVHADPTRVTQIIGNLLHNAVKFTPPGSRTTLSIRRAGDEAEISVRDEGPGIPPDVLKNLFEPFVQGEKTLDRSTGGLGLGLALVKGLVELHGGRASAHSAGRGRGATFVVRLPLEQGTASRAERREGAAAPSPPRRVLIIEDNLDAAETLKEALELNHHAVDVAHTGSEGIQRAHALKPDVVLCDIGLPDLNGFEVARAIRAEPALRSITLVALSGYALPEDVDRAKAAGFELHLAKPPDLVALERFLGEARAQAPPA